MYLWNGRKRFEPGRSPVWLTRRTGHMDVKSRPVQTAHNEHVNERIGPWLFCRRDKEDTEL
jgi:hypothetical protein